MIKAVVSLAAVLVLGACSDSGSGDDDTGGSGSGSESGSQQETTLEGLTPDRLCELLPNDTIEQALEVVVTDAKGRQSGRPPILSKTCRYSVEFALEDVDLLPPALTTDVSQTRGKSIDEVLDRAFTDLVSEDESVGDYERVDGLGDGAGYGNHPMDGGQLDESLLVVVFIAGEEQFQLDFTVSPRTPLEQLEPLATELLTALDAELR